MTTVNIDPHIHQLHFSLSGDYGLELIVMSYDYCSD